MAQQTGTTAILKRSAPVPDRDLDWVWPARDTFTDDSVAPRISQTCSELGSQRIRLIRILPGLLSDVIECETRVCFLSQAEDYTALSYTWGSPAARCHIIVDRQPRQIATNLWRFLRQARQLPLRYSSWLWVDALSIDQSDPWEKLEQVRVISDIFKSAKSVVVWLGPSYGKSDKAMKILSSTVPGPSGRMPRALSAYPLGPALLMLCERPYWRRLWVFQELKCSRKIELMCGAHHADFECLRRVLLTKSVDPRMDIHNNHVYRSCAMRMVVMIQEDRNTSLQSMLRETSTLRCADPRDKVYAILNAVSSGHQDIEPDYTTALPTLINRVLRNIHTTEEFTHLLPVSFQCETLAAHFGVNITSIFGEALVSAGTAIKASRHEKGLSGGPRYATPLEALSDMINALLQLDFAQSKEAKTLVGEVYIWCKKHDHRKIGTFLRNKLEYIRKLRKDIAKSQGRYNNYREVDENGFELDVLLPGEMQKLVCMFDEFVDG